MSTALFLFDQEHTFKSEPPYHTHTPWLLCTTQDSHKKQTGYSLGILQKTGWDWSGNWPCNPSWDQPPTSPSSPSNPRHGNIRSPAKCFTLQIYPYRVSPRGSAGTATFTAISTSLWGTLFWLQPFPCSSVCLIPETGHQCQTGHLALRNAKWRGRVSTPPPLQNYLLSVFWKSSAYNVFSSSSWRNSMSPIHCHHTSGSGKCADRFPRVFFLNSKCE